MKQMPLPIAPPPAERFDTVLVGANAAAVQHLRGLGLDGVAAAPVYLWGETGSGKTRLLRALAAERQASGERVGWFDAADALPWGFDEAWSLVVVDRCEQLDAARQQAAFALFIDAGTHGVQWLAAGRQPPVDLPLRDDLRTRLGWGHIFALQPLGEAETRSALRREADRRGIFLSDDVMDYLLTRFTRNLGHLMAMLDRLDEFALAEHRAITVPLLKKMLAEDSTLAGPAEAAR
ncbi:DnaA regulatory inactivator Hda [Aquabacterium sp. OR-4]|uniref:DnaA regulatory inactivator Hda n=1 Tax=Aquabacterium sp. OR-4 TaxID=2978127 RepID=UPI0021B4ABE8|nr:DnaA regulatory inactivator Hda [Aquabacterium sp. OR-4]MDT7835791.1 DnaA regulatory inactivator Hda [Aquabacterium sp. OR-4]